MKLEKCLNFVLLSALLPILSAYTAAASPPRGGRRPFLKEILQGRCYDQPPTGDFRDCPSIVDGFVAILESQLDDDITLEAFESHLDFVLDLSVLPDDESGKNLVFLPFHHTVSASEDDDDDDDDDADDDLATKPQRTTSSHQQVWKSSFAFDDEISWTTPEYTPGGALLAGLSFCGIDKADEMCSLEGSNAYWTYWEAVYRRFAASAQGTVQIALPRNVNIDFMKRSIVNNIDFSQISNVAVYAMDDCTSEKVKEFLLSIQQAAGKEDAHDERVVCSDDPVEFILCVPDRNSDACTSYLNSCIHQQVVPPSSTKEDIPLAIVSEEEEDDEAATPEDLLPANKNSTADTLDQAGHLIRGSSHHHHQAIQTWEDHNKSVNTVILILFVFVLASYLFCTFRRGEQGPGAARSYWWEMTSYTNDNKQQSDTHSTTYSDSSFYGRRTTRRDHRTAQESSALLDEVTRNLFLDPNGSSISSDDDAMQTVILQ